MPYQQGPVVAGFDGPRRRSGRYGRGEASPDYQVGDSVVLNGWGVGGEVHWGGLAQKARLKGEWLVLPPQFTPRQAMAIGTAGYRDVVRGAGAARRDSGQGRDPGHRCGRRRGGVAVALLSKLGYTVVG